jgi:hypothetical protein
MITAEQRESLLAELNGKDFGDIKAKPDPERALIDAIQQQTKVLRILAAAVLYTVPTAPDAQPMRPQMRQRTRGRP